MRITTLKILTIILISTFLTSCNGFFKYSDARKNPTHGEARAKKNVKEGKGISLGKAIKGGRGTNYEFSTSNPMWRASLETLDFLPLTTVDYSGGIIITDWYSENNNQNESIKISIRFMTNEIRSDALNIKVFNRKCLDSLLNCKITETEGILVTELKKEILKKATIYKEMDNKKKGNKDYKYPKMKKKN